MPKVTIFTIALFFLIACNRLFAQQLQKQWDYRYGTIYPDYLRVMQPINNGGLILGGEVGSGISGDKSENGWGDDDYWIIKIDATGIKMWDKDFGGIASDQLVCLEKAYDGGYLIGGISNSPASGDKGQDTWGGFYDFDIWLVKTDSAGNKEWDKDYGTTSDDWLTCLRQTKDGGYLIGGITSADSSGDKSQPSQGGNDFWIIKLDSLGNKEWDKDFGTAGNDELQSVLQTSDGGYLLGGIASGGISGDKSQPTKGSTDYWIIKTDSLGVKQWDRDFGGNDEDDFVWMEPATDGGYILAGNSYSLISGDKTQNTWGSIYPYNDDVDYWIVKIDTAGNKVWDRDYGSYYQDLLTRLFVTNDGGYLLSGRSVADAGGDKTEDNFQSAVDMWMIKVNMLGEKQFDKTALTGSCYDYSFIAPAVQTTDGCYVMAWSTAAQPYGDKTQPNWGYPGYEDYWAIKYCDTSHLISFLTADKTLCEKFCTNFYDQSTGSPTAWHWSFPGGTPDTSLQKNPTGICYNTPGTFDVTLVTTNAYGNDTLTLQDYITVNPTPAIPNITQVGYTLTCSPAYSYQWQLNAVAITGATNQSYNVLQTGYYTVIVGDTNSCVNSATEYVLISGMADVESANGFSIYPNPSTGSFAITVSEKFAGATVTIEVEDALGKKVFSSTQKITSPAAALHLKLPAHSVGIYFISLRSAATICRKTVLVQ